MDLLSMTLSELEEFIVSLGEKKFRAKQLYGWMLKGESLENMSNLPKSLVQLIKSQELYYV
ncbi:MAG: 23S rRNA (adenine(2503)-C(2))-methyltransferase RlmN, partial [Clostridia bacterium]|nr:23S rRNA (adenine(2503)-C(2))-methyltransferase RlmN [Clostridia bacterium]